VSSTSKLVSPSENFRPKNDSLLKHTLITLPTEVDPMWFRKERNKNNNQNTCTMQLSVKGKTANQ